MTTTITITIHGHLDPRCIKYDGTPLPRYFKRFYLSLFGCETCAANRRKAKIGEAP